MPIEIPKDLVHIQTTFEEYEIYKELSERRVYLSREIASVGYEDGVNEYTSTINQIVKFIIDCNREDKDKPVNERTAIKLYIDSPGGDIGEGLALISIMEISKTPIYTINVGEWSSMAFLIGIAGHKRFSLPYSTFLLHEGTSFAGGATNKVQDRVKFDERLETQIIKPHVLSHGNMSATDYDALTRVEYYMLPEDALEKGFIDEIVNDIDAIL
ncbi:ATP-dependent Clp protease proteolytic subunit [Candidatus Saccharibacteria bacterium]|nr:ATP-dependent Clp protease proteolytic subunit [Candidatus Saccharibacteria bacterium]